MLAQRIGQGGHDSVAVLGSELGQARKQIQGIDILGWTKLWADEVQVARGGADVAVAQQTADGVQVHPAFEQVGRKTMTPIPMSE